MFIRTIENLEQMGRIKYPADETFRSARFITSADKMGFSYNENKVSKDISLPVWLKHHWEANFIVAGSGKVTDLTRDTEWVLTPGTLYVVGPNDRHQLELSAGECHISVFYPPLSGNERFDSDGSYEPSGPIPKTDRRMFVRHLDQLRHDEREVQSNAGKGRSVSLLSQADQIGFELEYIELSPDFKADRQNGPNWSTYHIFAGKGKITDGAGKIYDLSLSVAINIGPNERYHIFAEHELTLLKISSAKA